MTLELIGPNLILSHQLYELCLRFLKDVDPQKVDCVFDQESKKLNVTGFFEIPRAPLESEETEVEGLASTPTVVQGLVKPIQFSQKDLFEIY